MVKGGSVPMLRKLDELEIKATSDHYTRMTNCAIKVFG
jgi:hypothetical protein